MKRPGQAGLVPFQGRAAVCEFLLELGELIPPLQGVDQHFARVFRDPLGLDPIFLRQLGCGKCERPGELLVDEELPERFLAGEMLELPATRLALLEKEGRDQFARRVGNPELSGLR